jgi:integrase
MREGNKLNALKVAKLAREKKKGWVPDGHNLYLKDGSSWVFRFVKQAHERWMGLGPVHTVSLQEARIRARQARQILLEGKDPLTVKQDAITATILDAARTITFKQAALEFLATDRVEQFKSEVHRKQWHSMLEKAFPVIGDLPLQSIDSALVLRVLLPIWKRTPETGSRLRGRIERVFAWAAAHQYFTGTNPATRDVLRDALPTKPKANHHSAMPYAELGAFMEKLREKESLSAKALELTILTAVRTGETIGMVWSEIDFATKVWTIPAERMKADREHRVPLSDRAIAVLASVPRNGSALVFPLSNAAMSELLKGTNGNGYTVHGFRSTFSDWARDNTAYSRDVVEMALAHSIKDKTEAAYRRGDALAKRARLMTEWAKFTEMPSVSATVTPINKERA